jgi:hypothetical protein
MEEELKQSSSKTQSLELMEEELKHRVTTSGVYQALIRLEIHSLSLEVAAEQDIAISSDSK